MASSTPRPLVGAPLVGSRFAALLEASAGARAGHDLPRRSLVFDAAVMLVFVGAGLLLLKVFSPRASLDDVVFVFLVNVPLVLRRRFPRVAFLLVFAAGLLQMLMRVPIGLYDAGMLFALYSVVGYTVRRVGLLALALGGVAVVLGAVLDWWSFVDRQLGVPTVGLRMLSATGAAVLVVVCWAMGERLRSARYGVIALTQRTEQLEREQEQQALLAAAAERARIAREMHDVIAHGLSVMIVQADGAAYVVEQSPETGRRALEQISSTGRESLAQMRSLLGLLRTDEGSPAVAPQPDLDELDALVDAATLGGRHVILVRDGQERALPPMVSLTAYRVVQEALTNARKHGGDEVAIRLAYRADGLEVQVNDSGATVPTEAEPQRQGRLTQSPGHGLAGMRERVAAVGGDLTVGPVPGGWRVLAWLPETPDVPVRSGQDSLPDRQGERSGTDASTPPTSTTRGTP